MDTNYDKYIVTFSGGKDSTACFLHLLDLGVPKHKIELWHQEVDGMGETFMDWECTKPYCEAFAKAFGVPIYFQWKSGGFKREMLRENQRTAPINFEDENKVVHQVGGTKGKLGTRQKFPQVSPDLNVRWCSAYLKIDVCATAIRNLSRFKGIKTAVISGERAEESSARSGYAYQEVDRADLRNGKKFQRHVQRIRPIINWSESEVWAIIQRYKVRVHPAYYLGWGRVSCKFCIFGSANQFASAYKISRAIGQEITRYESIFNNTIKQNESVKNLVARGQPYEMDEETVNVATSHQYKLPIFMDKWLLPAGAFGESCGPT